MEFDIKKRFDELNNKLNNCKEISAIPGIHKESEILMNKFIGEIEIFNQEKRGRIGF